MSFLIVQDIMSFEIVQDIMSFSSPSFASFFFFLISYLSTFSLY